MSASARVPPEGVQSRPVHRFRPGDGERAGEDFIVREEPLEIRFGGAPVATVMRTPRDDADLAVGYLFVEGWIDSLLDVEKVLLAGDERHASAAVTTGPPRCRNVANVLPRQGYRPPRDAGRRSSQSTAACGICGKRTIAEAMMLRPPPADEGRTASETPWDPDLIASFPDELRKRQELFGWTGGLHAAGLFDERGALASLREDIGRHNAVDKVIGDSFRRGLLPLDRYTLQVSGRVSFEIVQKAYRAGLKVIAAVSGVSTLAVDFAERSGITLIGFVRGGRLAVYTHAAKLSQAAVADGAARPLQIPPDETQ